LLGHATGFQEIFVCLILSHNLQAAEDLQQCMSGMDDLTIVQFGLMADSPDRDENLVNRCQDFRSK